MLAVVQFMEVILKLLSKKMILQITLEVPKQLPIDLTNQKGIPIAIYTIFLLWNCFFLPFLGLWAGLR